MANNFKWKHTLCKQYRKKIEGNIFKNEKVINVERKNKKILVHSKSFSKKYDNLIFAIHSDDILNLLQKATDDEREVFSKYKYEENNITIHQDQSLMPNNKNVWSSWNVLNESKKFENKNKLTGTDWINKLQNLYTNHPLLVTLNPPYRNLIDKKK